MKTIGGKNLVLIGFMGTGKTEVGRLLAESLNRKMVDTDRLIVEREGCSIGEIFSSRGEPYFRALEKIVVAEVAVQRGLVVSTGGGAVLDADNAASLRQSGFVVWLDAGPEALRERLRDDESRPLLKNNDLVPLYNQREAIYRAAAHVRVDTTDRSPLAAAEEIMEILRRHS